MNMKRVYAWLLTIAMCMSLCTGFVFAENAAKPNGQFVFEESVDNLTASDEDRSFYFTFDFDDAPTAFMTFNLTVTGEASVSANQSENGGVVSLVTTAQKNNYKDVTWDRDAVRGAYANANNIEATEIDGFDFHLPANASGEFEITLTVTQWGYYTNDAVATDNSKTYYVNTTDAPLTYTTTINVAGGGSSGGDEPVQPDEPEQPTDPEEYTVTLTADKEETVIGGTVVVTVSVDKPVNGIQAYVTYDADVFTCDKDRNGTGSVEIYDLQNKTFGGVLDTLTFTAKTATTKAGSTIGFESAVVGGYADFLNNAAEANQITVNVKAKAQVSIASGIANGSVTSDQDKVFADEKVALTVTPNEGYKLGSITVTDANGKTVSVAEDDTFTMPNTNVTVDAEFVEADALDVIVEEVEGATVTANVIAAKEGTDVTITVEVDPGKQLSSVVVLDADGNEVPVTDNGDGTFTFVMPATAVTVRAIVPNFEVAVSEYVTGVTLVTVTGDSAKGYTYNGEAMYHVAQYNACAWLVDGSVTLEAATAQIQEAKVDQHLTIATGYDVNKASDVTVVDFYDAGAAFGCYNKAYDVAANMAMYLRADVNGSKTVDATDVSLILNNYTK